MTKNILFVGAGRRVEMARLFKEKTGCFIYSYERGLRTPISFETNIINGLEWNNPKIIQHLIENIEKHKIDLCIPFMDKATVILNQLPFELKNICVCSDEYITSMCFNKKTFEDRILQSSLRNIYPQVEHNKYPRISKPIHGFGSRNIQIIHCIHEDTGSLNGKDRVVQKYIENAKEYTVDFYVDKAGRFIGNCIRERIRVAGGEVQDAVVVDDDEINSVVENLVGEFYGFRGPCCAQFLRGGDSRLYLVEINARFGGGAPLSIIAGFDMIDMINREYFLNKEIHSEDYIVNSGMFMTRCYQSYFFT